MWYITWYDPLEDRWCDSVPANLIIALARLSELHDRGVRAHLVEI